MAADAVPDDAEQLSQPFMDSSLTVEENRPEEATIEVPDGVMADIPDGTATDDIALAQTSEDIMVDSQAIDTLASNRSESFAEDNETAAGIDTVCEENAVGGGAVESNADETDGSGYFSRPDSSFNYFASLPTSDQPRYRVVFAVRHEELDGGNTLRVMERIMELVKRDASAVSAELASVDPVSWQFFGREYWKKGTELSREDTYPCPFLGALVHSAAAWDHWTGYFSSSVCLRQSWRHYSEDTDKLLHIRSSLVISC
jgi:hypothetical protein